MLQRCKAPASATRRARPSADSGRAQQRVLQLICAFAACTRCSQSGARAPDAALNVQPAHVCAQAGQLTPRSRKRAAAAVARRTHSSGRRPRAHNGRCSGGERDARMTNAGTREQSGTIRDAFRCMSSAKQAAAPAASCCCVACWFERGHTLALRKMRPARASVAGSRHRKRLQSGQLVRQQHCKQSDTWQLSESSRVSDGDRHEASSLRNSLAVSHQYR